MASKLTRGAKASMGRKMQVVPVLTRPIKDVVLKQVEAKRTMSAPSERVLMRKSARLSRSEAVGCRGGPASRQTSTTPRLTTSTTPVSALEASSTSTPRSVAHREMLRKRRARMRANAITVAGTRVQRRMRIRAGAPSILVMKSVGSCSEDFRMRYEELLEFALRENLRVDLPEELDLTVVERLDLFYLDGWTADVGEKLIAAIRFARPEFGRGGKFSLPRSLRAMRGFRKAAPASSKAALPMAWVRAIIAALLWRRKLAIAQLCACQVDLMTRPGELLKTQVEDVTFQSDVAAVLLHPSDREEKSKAGQTDDVVIADDVEFPTSDILRARSQGKAPGALLFEIKAKELRDAFALAVKDVGLSKVDIVAYQLRHSGAANSALLRRRSIADIQKRLRHSTLSSTRRYEKHGRMQRLLAQSPSETLTYAERVSSEIKDGLLGGGSVRKPPHA